MTLSDKEPVQFKNLVDLLQQRAEATPDQDAYTVLDDAGDPAGRLTYAQLDGAARAIASRLLSEGAVPGDRTLLVLPEGLEFITALFGCLYAGVIAVPAYPPRRSLDALDRIVSQCGPTIGLTTGPISEHIATRFRDSQAASLVRWKVLAGDPDATAPVTAHVHPVALLQYTSGSTGCPKGVILSHDNLIANLTAIQRVMGIQASDVVVGWLPLYHDMGLIGNVLSSLYSGVPLYFMSPASFAQDPMLWLRAISRFQATISGGPDFAYNLCIARSRPEQLANLDLRSWSVAFTGSEPVRAAVLDAFANKFHDCGFRRTAFAPCYGMAESSLMVSSCQRNEFPRVRYVSKPALGDHKVVTRNRRDADVTAVVSCGSPIPDHTVAIVDPETGALRPGDAVGEIWVRGPSVAAGYWNNAEATAAAFGVSPAGDAAAGYLRTGDLGFVQDGHVFICGRLKDVIILRGRNHYAQDIEAVASASHPDLQPDGCAAFEVEQGDAVAFVVVQEIRRTSLRSVVAETAIAAIQTALGEQLELSPHTILLVGPKTLLRTTSGKLRRQEMRRLFEAGQLTSIARTVEAPPHPAETALGELELALRAEVAEALRLPAESLNTQTALLQLGLDSLKAMEIKHRIEQCHGLAVSVEEFFSGLSIATLAERIAAARSDRTAQDLDRRGTVPPRSRRDAGEPAAHAPGRRSLGIASPDQPQRDAGMELSVMFFSSDAASAGERDRYDLLLRSVEHADRHGLRAVWIPERHFHRFGGLYPNPSVLAAALAVRTSRIRIRAGSVVLPLHDPIRVAEEWSVVDNLSGGRVDLAFAQGWNPDDFALAPDRFASRLDAMYAGLDVVRSLWRGERRTVTNGQGEPRQLCVYPPPRQRDLDIWITCSGSPARFEEAGARGANVLTGLLFQDRTVLAEKIAAYRRARAQNGFDPDAGHVTVMLHTFVWSREDEIHSLVRRPFLTYLADSVDLWQRGSTRLAELSAREREDALEFAFQRYVRTHALVGTPQRCLETTAELHALGVDEIACLIDFGVPAETVLESLDPLAKLNQACAALRRHRSTQASPRRSSSVL